MGGAESPAPSGSRGARPAWDYRLTFAVEAGRVVVVESRQLPSEHDPNLSFWSPVLQPGEERRAEAGGAGTGDAARGRAGACTLRNDGGLHQSWLRKGGGRRMSTNRNFGWRGGATSGHVYAQINFIVSFQLVQ